MGQQFIPIFEPSGRGLIYDLTEIKKSEMMSMAWYKGRLNTLLNSLAGRKYVDNILVYGESFSIGDSACPEKNSPRDKDVKEFLELLGFDEDGISQVCQTRRQGGVADIVFKWQEKYRYEENDVKVVYDAIKEALNGVTKVVETNSILSYKETIPIGSRTAKTAHEILGNIGTEIDFNIEEKNYFSYVDPEDIEKWKRTPITLSDEIHAEVERVNEHIDIAFLDSMDNDITDDYPDHVINAVRTMLTLHGENFMTLSSLTKIADTYNGEFNDGQSEGGEQADYYEVTSQAIYIKPFSSTFLDDSSYYTLLRDTEYKGIPDFELGDIIQQEKYVNYHLNNFWIFRESEVFETKLVDSLGLFYQQGSSFITNKNPIYMTVEGLKKVEPGRLSYIMSQYSHLQVIQQKKSGFFGSFVGRIVGGIINAVVSIIGFLSGIAYYIPGLRLQIQAIMWLFTGEWNNNREQFKAFATRIVLAVIAIVITYFGGYHIAIQIISYALATYSLITDLGDMADQFEEADRQRATQAEQAEIIKKKREENAELNSTTTIREYEEANKYMYSDIYNSHELIDSSYVSPFDQGGLYDIKFGQI